MPLEFVDGDTGFGIRDGDASYHVSRIPYLASRIQSNII